MSMHKELTFITGVTGTVRLHEISDGGVRTWSVIFPYTYRYMTWLAEYSETIKKKLLSDENLCLCRLLRVHRSLKPVSVQVTTCTQKPPHDGRATKLACWVPLSRLHKESASGSSTTWRALESARWTCSTSPRMFCTGCGLALDRQEACGTVLPSPSLPILNIR